LGFPLIVEVGKEILEKILLAVSLKVKKVQRHPGFILHRTYNLRTDNLLE